MDNTDSLAQHPLAKDLNSRGCAGGDSTARVARGRRWPGAAALVLLGLLAVCQRAEPPPGAAPGQPAASAAAAGAAGSVAHVEGIEWFDGSIEAAFAAAQAQDKPVFLYWGAEWCPPCYDLKAHVFPRADFQQALRQFVPVYLDGDAPGAQRIAEQFEVQGYPSVLVLAPDHRELARISGGSDLASYAQVLDLALDNARPIQSVMGSLAADANSRLGAADCRRLAWYNWYDEKEDAATLAAALQQAAQRCPADARVERDRLLVTAADLLASHEREAIGQGRPRSARLTGLMQELDTLLADPVRRADAGNVLLSLDEGYFVVARLTRPEHLSRLRQDYFAMLDAVESDERQSDTMRLLSAARRLQAAKALDAKGAVPADVTAQARATLDAFLARDYDANARAGIVNSASWVLHELGDDAQLRNLLEQQMKVSRTPYYYMPDLADIDERAGNTAAALALLERGYRESRGPATRFQWGILYVDGLLRMAPDDVARVQGAVLEVIGELAGPDRIHARTRSRLERLDASLGEWADGTDTRAALSAIGRRWQEICAGLPETDVAKSTCPAMLG